MERHCGSCCIPVPFRCASCSRLPRRWPTGSEVLAAIIREQPEPIAALNSKAPSHLRWMVERCLAKEPRDRYAATEDLARDLATLREHVSDLSSEARVPLETPRRRARWG